MNSVIDLTISCVSRIMSTNNYWHQFELCTPKTNQN